MLDRRAFLILSGALLAGPTTSALAADAEARLIERFYASIQQVMRQASGQSVAARAQTLSGPVNATFDIGTMTRLAVGSEWSRIPGGQQAAIRQAFGSFLVATYAKRIEGYSGERFEVAPTAEPRRTGKLVRTKIIESSGTTAIDYIVSGGKAIDVYLNGAVSELASRRSEFESLLASGGPTALQQGLQQRTQRLLAG